VKIGSNFMVPGIIYPFILWSTSAVLNWCATARLCSAMVSQLWHELLNTQMIM
jgi:hypothetical protein